MLCRAASNAYSWWWASHVRTKHSKWLESNLQDMDEKVKHMLKLIDQDGDSFAKRAEMYYRKRPELISFVEESYRMYRALAEKFDHLSGELQNANRTIATVFPEQVQYSMEEEEEEERAEEEKTRPTTPLPAPSPKNLPEVPKGEIPKFLKFAREDTEPTPKKPSPAMKKWQSKRRSSRLINLFDPNITEDEALKEIDKLQKRILALQTEKEFIKSSYESRISKYCEIEKEIAGMQETVGHLQDEFSIAAAIEDNEARTIMASTALKSCQEALTQLQEKHDKSIEEARVEYQRVKDNHKKFEELKDEFFQNQEDENLNDDKETPVRNVAAVPLTLERFEVGHAQQERRESESIREKIKEHFEINSESSFTVTELAEKIDELATKVVSLETAILSQNALMTRLKSDSYELQEHLHSVENDKAMAVKDTNKLNEKLRKVEEELRAVQDLNRSLDTQNNNLDTHFTEARSNLDHLYEKLKHAKELKEEETEATRSSILQEAPSISVHVDLHDEHEDHLFELDLKPTNDYESEADEKYHEAPGPPTLVESTTSTSNSKDIYDDLGTKESQEQQKQPQQENDAAKKENSLSTPKESVVNPDPLQEFYSNKEDSPNWQELFLKGLDDREKALLAEYTTVLRKYKEAKRKISDIESKNRETLFEITIQLRDLRNANNLKDEEIQSLRKSINVVQMNPAESRSPAPAEIFSPALAENCTPAVAMNISNQAPQLQLGDLLETHPIPQVITDNESEKLEEVKVFPVDEPEPRTISPIEEKFRRDIDDVLEENLDFWLRFSTSFHQIQKFKTTIRDLEFEYSKLKEKKKQESSTTSTTNYSLRSDARPIYKHLREIQTELTLWLEQNAHLKDELKSRLASLGNIQEEISKILLLKDFEGDQFTSYQAARFQGEILNMQQENNKVKNELQTGMEHVKRLQVDTEQTLSKMDEELNFSGTRTNMMHTITMARIPLRAFLFGVKAKKQKKPSLFSCINPALQKQYSNLHGNIPV